MSSAATILLVDDLEQNRKLLKLLLEPEGYKIFAVATGKEALDFVARTPPQLILLDVMMPDIDGYTVASMLKADSTTVHIPIIMVSAQDDHSARLKGLEAGAEDYLTTPVDRAELWLRVRNLLRLKNYSDNERKNAEINFHRLKHYDVLTGLPNRLLFCDTLEKTLRYAAEQGGHIAVLFLDLDHFTIVNETLGHAQGDELLCQLSTRLIQCMRIRDTIARIGSDEFALILVMEDGPHGAALVVNKIREVLQSPFRLGSDEIAITASIGLTMYPHDAEDPQTLIKYADTALYRAKQAGSDTFCFFTAQMNTDILKRVDLEAGLRKAIENNEFILYYQPKVQLSTGLVVGVEALIRWQRPGYGLVSPNEFIPVLEETGLIVRVGSWVIDAACRQVAQWMQSAVGPMQISINVSGRQFLEGDLEEDIEKALSEHGIPPHLLELELTEGSLMDNTARTVAILENMEKRGVQVSIDDFGTGYSSLAYLRRFPVNKLKIDIAFIRDILTDPDAAAITLAIIGMAHTLKLDVVAEGVETEAQLHYLQNHNCDQIQGYYFSPPLPVKELEKILHEKKHLSAKERGLTV